MDNKLKFSDRLKALLKTEACQDVDPYIFSEPEPISTASKKNLAMVTSSSLNKTMQNCRNSRSRGKCVKQNSGVMPSSSGDSKGLITNLNFESSNNLNKNERLGNKHCSSTQHNRYHNARSSLSKVRKQNRDHMLLYYPRAGDEISDSESSGDEMTIYQHHWFSGDAGTSLSRSARLSQLRSQLRRRLIQLHRGGADSEALLRERAKSLLQAAIKDPVLGRTFNDCPGGKLNGPLFVGGSCGAEGCYQTSLPCTRHCSRHIMLNSDQLLFEHCTAKFSDNTQCCVPVFDVSHELPLCPEHARKRDNYHRKAQESKPKKPRSKKPTSPTVARPKPKARPKKRKRPPTAGTGKLAEVVKDSTLIHEDTDCFGSMKLEIAENTTGKQLNNFNTPQSISNTANLNLGLGLGSLGLGSGLKVELGDHEVFASLDPAEHDFGNVLNNLPADAFNDLFIESRNGEYEPSREEEEELERALEAVDKDVRNLERMGQTHGLLEPGLLAQLMSDIAS